MPSEWLFRSFLRWGATVGLEEVKRLQAEGIGRHVQSGGRMLTATAHGGKSSTFTFPADLTVSGMNQILEKVVWMLENFDEDEVKNYLRNYPSSTAKGWFGHWYP